MKLQNRQNPKIIADLEKDWLISVNGNNILLFECGVNGERYKYATLKELYKEWKDYTTLLPVSIRESFKHWAKFNKIEKVRYFVGNNEHSWFVDYEFSILSYDLNITFDYLEDGKEYTVKELVGD